MMPESERDTGPEVEDYYPWDCDNEAPDEQAVAELLDEGEDDDE